MPIELRELKAGDRTTLKDFLAVVDGIYKDAPYHVCPINKLLLAAAMATRRTAQVVRDVGQPSSGRRR